MYKSFINGRYQKKQKFAFWWNLDFMVHWQLRKTITSHFKDKLHNKIIKWNSKRHLACDDSTDNLLRSDSLKKNEEIIWQTLVKFQGQYLELSTFNKVRWLEYICLPYGRWCRIYLPPKKYSVYLECMHLVIVIKF